MIYHETTGDGLPVVRVETGLGTLVLSLHGGHIMSWIPAGGEEVFYMSPLAIHGGGKALRGGVPVCWPWFGKAGVPAHGLARTSMWILDREEETEEGTAGLILSFQPEGRNGLRAEMEITLGRRNLVQKLVTRAGVNEISLSEALHSYFRVGDIAQVSLSGLADVPFVEHAGPGASASEAPLRLKNAMDRIYGPTLGKMSLRDDSLGRTIEIERKGSQSVIVWNPWLAGAAGMADLPDDGWRHFLCVETGNVSGETLTLAPGETHAVEQSLFVK